MDAGEIILIITAVASPLIAAGVTLTVAVLRFDLGRSQSPPESPPGNPDGGLTRQDLQEGFRDIIVAMNLEVGRLEGQLTAHGATLADQALVLAEIQTTLRLRQNPSEPPAGSA